MNPKKLKLLKIDKTGYVVDGLAGEVRVTHEALVAILTGLSSGEHDEALLSFATQPHDFRPIIRDSARLMRRQAAGLAWLLGSCSWDSCWQAVPHNKVIFHYSE